MGAEGVSEQDRGFAALRPRWERAPEDPALRSALRALAAQGHAPSACALAVLAFEGIGGPLDPAAAFLWALRGAHGGFAAAAAMVGDFYLHAEPEHRACVRLTERALPWHEQAALAGHAHAALATSDSYRMGRGCERDFARAYLFVRVAEGLRDPPAPIIAVLAPSLITDLQVERIAELDAQAVALLADLPRADADLDDYWRSEQS